MSSVVCDHVKSGDHHRQPQPHERVWKDECVYCFDSQDSSGGIDVCLSCFKGGCVGPLKHASKHNQRTGHALYLNIRRTPKPITPETEKALEEQKENLTKLAIGVEGGAMVDSADRYDTHTFVRCYGCGGVEVDRTAAKLEEVVQAVLNSLSASKQTFTESWELKRQACEHGLLLHPDVDAPKLEDKSNAHCSKCDKDSGLWLCLQCGHVGCGRESMGGNGHAVQHNQDTGHPLVCMLGTISAEGTADVFCYSCDDMVIDPNLVRNMEHFGIDVQSAKITEKTLAEKELALNQTLDFMGREDGKAMEPLFGPGLTGMRNIGNSCYLASVVQSIFSLPRWRDRYTPAKDAERHTDSCMREPHECWHCQAEKLADGLFSGRYSIERRLPGDDVPTQAGIPPYIFKQLISRNHAEFRTQQQQDAHEFFQHLVNEVNRAERVTKDDPTDVFTVAVRQRLECTGCGRTRYKTVRQPDLSVPIAHDVVNVAPDKNESLAGRAERESKIHVPLELCFRELLSQPDPREGFNCPQCKAKTLCHTTQTIESFPEALVVQVRRFVADGWVPRKLAIEVDVEDELDLSEFASQPPPADELSLPDDEPEVITANEEVVAALMSMGFGRNACEKASLATGNANAQAASEWLFGHMDDPTLNDPPASVSGAATNAGGANISDESIAMLAGMGFTDAQARKALRETGGSMDRAVEWIFSHPDDPGDDGSVPASAGAADGGPNDEELAPMKEDDRPPVYQLHAVIVHKGVSAHSGHYIAYVYDSDEPRWVQFDDSRVYNSTKPRVGQAYVLVFRKTAAATQ